MCNGCTKNEPLEDVTLVYNGNDHALDIRTIIYSVGADGHNGILNLYSQAFRTP